MCDETLPYFSSIGSEEAKHCIREWNQSADDGTTWAQRKMTSMGMHTAYWKTWNSCTGNGWYDLGKMENYAINCSSCLSAWKSKIREDIVAFPQCIASSEIFGTGVHMGLWWQNLPKI